MLVSEFRINGKVIEPCLCEMDVNSTKRQNFRLVQSQSICRRQNNSRSKVEICVGKSRKHYGKREKMLVTSISPFSTMFSKAFFSRGV